MERIFTYRVLFQLVDITTVSLLKPRLEFLIKLPVLLF